MSTDEKVCLVQKTATKSCNAFLLSIDSDNLLAPYIPAFENAGFIDQASFLYLSPANCLKGLFFRLSGFLFSSYDHFLSGSPGDPTSSAVGGTIHVKPY
jgi:hypothetical protein